MATPSVVAAFKDASLINPAVISTLSAALAASVPIASAPKPAASALVILVCPAVLSVIVSCVALVFTAEVISATSKVNPAEVAPSPSISQVNFVQSS